MLSVNSQIPRINARGIQDSQSQRVKIAMRSTVKLNSKSESWRRASGMAAPDGRLKGLSNEYVTQKF
jgi:hypothetical protein